MASPFVLIAVIIPSNDKKPTMPNRKIMATAAKTDRLAPDREASVRSRGIFLRVNGDFVWQKESCVMAPGKEKNVLYGYTSSRLRACLAQEACSTFYKVFAAQMYNLAPCCKRI